MTKIINPITNEQLAKTNCKVLHLITDEMLLQKALLDALDEAVRLTDPEDPAKPLWRDAVAKAWDLATDAGFDFAGDMLAEIKKLTGTGNSLRCNANRLLCAVRKNVRIEVRTGSK